MTLQRLLAIFAIHFSGCFFISGAANNNGSECGDFIRLEGAEECDDGNQNNLDSCKNDCTLNVCGDASLFAGVEECDDGNDARGDGCSELCQSEACGNQRLDAGEECDDGNGSNADNCSTQCALAFCGDGLLQIGQESCDDGNNVPGDGCGPDCLGEVCGNNVLDAGEQCDDGNTNNTDECTGSCEDAICGDGLLKSNSINPEQCDDGNIADGDGCSQDCDIEVCGNGVLDFGEQCDDANANNNDDCAASCRLAACGDGFLQPGEGCDDGDQSSGDGCNFLCQLESCGNNVLDAGEQCDDGNTNNLDDCTGFCKNAFCGDGFTRDNNGDGIVDPGDEQCDDGDQSPGDGCNSLCALEICGNGVLDAGEQCDDGNLNNDDSCTSQCLNARCGDGFVQAGAEGCDDRNLTNGDGCSSTCFSEFCGNGFVDSGEQCEDGNNNNNDDCTTLCRIASCGDNFLQTTGANIEECDDGDQANGDGCSSLCRAEFCGNNRVDPGEACDDGNSSNIDQCTNTCSLPGCSDGFIQTGEQCDDRNITSGDGCSSLCQTEICGNSVLDAGEQCDDGNQLNNDGCTNDCLLSACGDGVTNFAVEQCDDGNQTNGDGCSSLCRAEICGNGALDLGEQCDDFNSNPNDACTNACLNAICGDSFTRANTEQCDDGNTNNGDGCNSSCQSESCGNGVLDAGEQCDDGNTSNTDACTNFCLSAACGDSFTRAGIEECDDGNLNATDGCSSGCQSEICGNNRIDAGEQCDDGNSANTDACTNDCLNPICGDGFTRANIEECDDGNTVATDGCASCQASICGNGRLDFGEQCDDGDLNNQDACLTSCTIALCGDGAQKDLDGDGNIDIDDEECDDGNQNNTDACNNECSANLCGDGIVLDQNANGNVDAGDEQCDDGNNIDSDSCTNLCTLPVCGDGILSGVEECDDHNFNNNDSCTNSCKPARCGDGFVQPGEDCDDGDTIANFPCSSTCTLPNIEGFSAGGSHTCINTSVSAVVGGLIGGEVVCWGDASSGQLGYGNTNNLGDNESPGSGGFLSIGLRALTVESGTRHTCARLADGNIRCWGDNSTGQLGTASVSSVGVVDTPLTAKNARVLDEVAQFAAGQEHTCARLSSGKVRCWGNGAQGRLGYESTESIADDSDDEIIQSGDLNLGGVVTQIAAGDRHTCALLATGKVKCWGDNNGGQLGYGNINDIGDNSGEMPPPDVNFGAGTVTQLAAGGERTCVLLSTGVVRCWGSGVFGSLGYGNSNPLGDNAGEMPTADVNIGASAIQIAMGITHTCVIVTGGNVRCWGNGAQGRLGYSSVNDIGDNETPNTAGDVNVGGVVTQLRAGTRHTCAILNTGNIRCWGESDGGMLGYGSQLDIGDNEAPAAAGDVPLGFVVTDLALGELHSCAKTFTGHVRCWGTGVLGRLGYGTQENFGDDEPAGFTQDIELGAAVIKIGVGRSHTCVSLNDGSTRCWGVNNFGQLGYGNTTNIGDNETPVSAAPVRIADDVLDLSAGNDFTCALMSDINGTVRCWGEGGFGQLGYGNTNRVGDNETPITAGNVSVGGVVRQLSTGDAHSCAILDNDTVRCWGRNNFGQLGYGNTNNIGDNELPSSVGTLNFGGDTAAFTSLGGQHSCAVMSNGALRCWGNNNAGQLGYGNTQNIGDNESALVTNVNVGDGFVLDVALGLDFTCALIADGDVTIRCWGANNFGQLGIGSTQNIGDNAGEMPPANVELSDEPITLTAGDRHVCARFQNGAVRCWGNGASGRLGNQSTTNTGDNTGEMPPTPIQLF